jgi:hypothetical protein
VLGAGKSARRARGGGQCRERSWLLFAFGVLACQAPLVVGESRVTPSRSDASGGSAQPPDERCPDAARLRVADDACWPTAHVGHWQGFVTGDARYSVGLSAPLLYPSGEVRLDVHPAGFGTLTFLPPASLASSASDAGLDAGAPDAGAPDAGAPDAAAPDAAVPPGTGGVSEGFAYSLVDLRMSGSPSAERRLDRWMQFSVSLDEAQQNAPSATSPSVSACDACAPPDELSVALLLSADGAALRGTLSSTGPEGALVAGLELIRE